MNDTTPPAADPARRRVEQEVADRVAAQHAAVDMAHRDDLARDVARAHRAVQATPANGQGSTAQLIKAWDALQAALDRLASAYGEDTVSTARCCRRICLDAEKVFTETPCVHEWQLTDTTCCDMGTLRLERCHCGAQRWLSAEVKQP